MLFARYANPFMLLDGMIQTGRFADFVIEFMNIKNEENLWDIYLHKVFDKSFADFKRSIMPRPQPTGEDIKTTVNSSKSILDGFIPTGTGGER